MSNFDVCYYSYVDLGVLLPLKIHIGRIKNEYDYVLPKFKTIDYDDNSILLHESISPNLFYGKFKDTLQLRFILETIYDFIDFENIKRIKITKNYFDFNKDEFVDFVFESYDISPNKIVKEYEKLLKYVEYVRYEYTKIIIKELKCDEEYPEITLEDDITGDKMMKSYEKYLQITDNQASFNVATKNFGVVLFDENKDKSWNEFSWREVFTRKLISKKNTDIDSFIERVKSKVLEVRRNTNKN